MKLFFQWVGRNKIWSALILLWIMFTFNIFGSRIIIVKGIGVVIVIVGGGVIWLFKKL